MSATQIDFGDIPLTVEAQLRCAPLSLRELLELGPGSVVKSRRAAGDSVDVRVSDRQLCQGEIIVIDNVLAVRLSDFDERR